MKFPKLGRVLLSIAGAVSITLGLTSCSNNRTVGYVYVLGTSVNGQPGGQINAFREDNNNGNLVNVAGSPTSSGGTNPVRAVVADANRFLYVLNQGTPSTDATGNTSYASANISIFSIGGYGQLAQQIQYASQGFGAKRIAVDSSGSHLFVLDEYAPVGITAGGTTSPTAMPTESADYPCLGADNFWHPVGDITVFNIDPATGRLFVQTNQRQQNLTYFPVGCFPIDFHLTTGYLFTMQAGSTSTNDLQTINVQQVANSTGQLTPVQTGIIRVTSDGSSDITALNGNLNGNFLYLLDTSHDLSYTYSVGTNGIPVTVSGSPFPINTQAVGPVQSIVDSTGKYFFAVNGGPASGTTNPNADISGYVINQSTGDLSNPIQNGFTSLATNGTISGPVCIFEDPTNQFLYTAGSLDDSITGRRIDPNTGTLSPLRNKVAFPTVGTPSWCLGISSTF